MNHKTDIIRNILLYSSYLSEHSSNHIREYMGKMHFGYLITVCAVAEEKCPKVFPNVGEHLYWEFVDPAAFEGTEEEKLQKFREIRDLIDKRIKNWLKEQEI